MYSHFLVLHRANLPSMLRPRELKSKNGRPLADVTRASPIPRVQIQKRVIGAFTGSAVSSRARTILAARPDTKIVAKNRFACGRLEALTAYDPTSTTAQVRHMSL